jgi:hypothetical protein
VVAGTQAEQELHEQLVNDALAGDQLFFFGRASSHRWLMPLFVSAAAARVDARSRCERVGCAGPRLVLIVFRMLAFQNSFILAHILFNWWQELTDDEQSVSGWIALANLGMLIHFAMVSRSCALLRFDRGERVVLSAECVDRERHRCAFPPTRWQCPLAQR